MFFAWINSKFEVRTITLVYYANVYINEVILSKKKCLHMKSKCQSITMILSKQKSSTMIKIIIYPKSSRRIFEFQIPLN